MPSHKAPLIGLPSFSLTPLPPPPSPPPTPPPSLPFFPLKSTPSPPPPSCRPAPVRRTRGPRPRAHRAHLGRRAPPAVPHQPLHIIEQKISPLPPLACSRGEFTHETVRKLAHRADRRTRERNLRARSLDLRACASEHEGVQSSTLTASCRAATAEARRNATHVTAPTPACIGNST